MTDYEYLFALTVQKKLKCRIKGKIFVVVGYGYELIIKITNEDNQTFETSIGDFTNKFLNDLTTNFVVYTVMREYKKFIFDELEKKYFFQD